jgi:type I restriction enzyme S subunit
MTSHQKQAERDRIPYAWDRRSLEEISDRIMVGIASAATHAYRSKGVPLIRNMNIRPGQIDDSDLLFIDEKYEIAYKNKRLQAGDLITMRTGYPGITAIVPSKYNNAQSFTTLIIRPNNQICDSNYLCHYLNSEDGINFFAQSQIGGAQKNVNANTLKCMLVPLPALGEQRAIAEALSDVDALLGTLDRLIAKKRDIKQAAMQQLLTGQTRLPGFNGKWEVKRLGDHVRFLRNGVNSRAELQSEGPVKYLHYGDIHANAGTFVTPTMLPSLPVEKAVQLDRLQDGDLVFADASEDMDGVSKSVEVRDVGAVEVVAGQHTIAARFDRSVLADRFKSLLQFCPIFAAHLRRLAAGTKVYATNRAHIASAEVLLPNTDEQTAIATVLSDMNAELEALKQRRAKTAALKQGMMQELLTGRTRLI